MAGLSAEQRNDYYLQEATRTGIHRPILAALFAAQQRPSLNDRDTGLGISPANRIPLEQVSTFAQQVQYAANTIRSMTRKLIDQGWQRDDLWNVEQGCYTDRFVMTIANGYVPPVSEFDAARLEPSDEETLLQAYQESWIADCKTAGLPASLGFVEAGLLQFVSEVPRYYFGISYQRQALQEACRIWHQCNDWRSAQAILLNRESTDPTLEALAVEALDAPLLQAIQHYGADYAGYPAQREALLRLVQWWTQSPDRETAIKMLEFPSAEMNIRVLDPALMAFVQRLPQSYEGKGEQRNALTETYRFWYGLDSRGTALQELGVDAQTLTASHPNRAALLAVASQLDRSLLEFVKQIPVLYQELESQREALIRLVQLWQGLDSRDQVLQGLLDQCRRLETARRDSIDAMPKPEPWLPAPRPTQWNPTNLQLYASIIENGSLTWAEATRGGLYRPTNQSAVEAIVRMAGLAQQVCDRLGRPLAIVRWYEPMPTGTSPASRGRFAIGDAITFYCDGLTGDQLYRALDPWWRGGLGRYRDHPYLCYLDGHSDRSRWLQ
ncbi:MAG: peptidase M15A [Elainella sp. Prado103]|jgi:hypothetical protein|nr:peptidase M15A [Elainella sp. Prado103]